ncbi:MAG: glycosyltransferase family 2 protein [Bacteroidetes bacterium]|nr:glycosyltransferase family 2 protein [Bacteroidota bacterium]
MKISVVVPVMNEEDNIKPLFDKIKEALAGHNFEAVIVDDGSTDRTVEIMQQEADERFRIVVLNKNYGQSNAMSAGIAQAEGDYIVTMDGDLQNDPSDIPMMIEKLESEGWDLVHGRRANRQDGMFLRKIPSKIANWIIRNSTDVHISDYGCTLKLFKKDIAKNLGLYGELHRFIPVLAKIQGASIVEIDVKHHARIHGTSKYGINRTFKVMSDLLLMLFFQKYVQKPMHLFGTMGIISFIIGLLVGLALTIYKFAAGVDIGGRPMLIFAVGLVLGGIQLISFGFIAELIMRTYYESQGKTVFRVKEVIVGKQEA